MFMRLYVEKPITLNKRAGGVAEGVGPEFKPQYHTQNEEQQCMNNQFLP
jgi:hypothetical protein